MKTQTKRRPFPHLTIVATSLLLIVGGLLIGQHLDTPAVLGAATTSTTLKEIFIPLGYGTSSAADWTDVPGVLATIDTSLYPKMKSVVLEVTVHVPTGNQTASVRLFNATDKYPVWFSDVSMSGSGPTFLTSSNLNLTAGKKQYQIQMKTQLQYPANLLQARLHITTY